MSQTMTTEQLLAVISTFTSVAAIAIAVFAVVLQKRQSDLNLHVTILRDFVREFFHDTDLRHLRFAASQYGLQRSIGSKPPGEVFDLFDFFDTLAIYHNKKAIDGEMAWTTFYYWVSHYFHAFSEELRQFHKESGLDMYRNLETMMQAWPLMGEKLKRIPAKHSISSVQLKQFFEDEIAACKDRASAI
ncbi:MAG: hypothetical protein ACREV4_01180 [Gammaproteobacteria bacterium]